MSILEFKSDHKPSSLKCFSGSTSPPECIQIPWVGRSSPKSGYMASGNFPKPRPLFPCLYKYFSELFTHHHHPTPAPAFAYVAAPFSLSPDSPSSEKPSLILLASSCLIPLFAYLLPRQDCELLGTETNVSQSLLQLYGPAQGLTQAREAADSVVRAQTLELHCLGFNLSSPINLLLCSWT